MERNAKGRNTGCVMFEVANGVLLGPNRVRLLRLIAEGATIENAASFVDIDFSHAIELIEKMNSIAELPIVQFGDSGGNCAYLTDAGITALANYDKIFAEWGR